MTHLHSDRLPAGRQPYDSLIGLRIGAVAGGIIGAVIGAVTGSAWILLVGAVIGGAAGFFSERRSMRNDARSIEPPEEL